QLRGRSGRQGDPGSSRFYLSLDDHLMRIFGGDRIKNIMTRIGMPENEELEARMVDRAIARAQKRVEGHNFDIRKHLLEYDDVVNRQRELIYGQRHEWLEATPEVVWDKFLAMVHKEILDTVDAYATENEAVVNWDVELLHKDLLMIFPVPEEINPDTMEELDRAELEDQLTDAATQALLKKKSELEAAREGLMDQALRLTILRAIDTHWQRHLTSLDMLREGIGFSSIAQRDPVVEYTREGFTMFREMQGQISQQACNQIFRVQPQIVQPVRRQVQAIHPNTNGEARTPRTVVKSARENIGRNDPCWCGSGKKYKNCHYKTDKQGQPAQ
ncbi:MAG: SEC-C domain-containing protein, partial [Anaerolineae bacterium]|nr:SEC-C domain-containing protein [Anaerolineae bacterium]